MISRLCAASGTRKASRQRQGGGVAVEFALVLPLVITLLLGVVTAGVAYSRALAVTNAVREGARFGATTVNDGNWEANVVARTRATHFDSSTSTSICARLMKNTSAGTAVPNSVVAATASCTAGAPPTPPAVESGKCVAMVWAARGFEIDTGLLPPFTGTIERQSVSRYEREC